MESEKINKIQTNDNNKKVEDGTSSNTNTKSDQLDLKKLITKIDNRVKTKVKKISFNNK
jgi:hypothetical protein